ncbi:dTDP-4-dehydrorhamnose 3,5-epimerase [Flavobacteriaceae bacterium M23B6Z8]
MKARETYLDGCFVIEPNIFYDQRGYFYESFQVKKFQELTGWNLSFVQDNVSVSKRGVLRGLHFQKGVHSQAKLISVLKGAVLDVVVDIRAGSETFGKHFKIILDDQNKLHLFIPKGFAHGFVSLSEETIFSYKCDAYYNKEAESGIIYNDESLAIDWEFPEKELIISEKDQALPGLSELKLV